MAADDGSSFPPERRRALRRALVLLGLFFVFVQVNRSGGGVLANYLGAERGLSSTDLGLVMGAMFFASAAVQLPTGLLFDRYGATRTLVGLGLVSLVGIVLFALAETTTGFVAGRVLIGFGHGGVITAVYLIAMGWAPPDRVAQATAGLVGIAGGTGAVLATTPLAVALEHFGLSVTFLGLAAATAVLTVVIAVLVRDRPAATASEPVRPAESFAESMRGLAEVITMPELRRIFAMGVCFTAPFMTVGGLWAGPYFRDLQGLSAESASLALLVMMVALHVGTFAYGPLERWARSRKRLILIGVAIEVLCLGVLVVWPTAPLAVAGALLFLFGCAAPFYVVLASHARAFVPSHRVGRALTSINLAGLTGVFVLQIATGAVIDAVAVAGGAPETGYRLVFATIVVVLLLAAWAYAGQPEKPRETV
ncbi:MAG: MFS transporter [Alphaproteobacteria bacterium]|nr:MFS transporter [Alphaproteobacteria bacterium]